MILPDGTFIPYQELLDAEIVEISFVMSAERFIRAD